MVYQATKGFPGDERFGLTSQMRRAAISIPANIAERFKRRGIRDKIHFYNIAEGSLEKLEYFFILSKELDYIPSNDYLMVQAKTVGRLLNRLIASTERRR